MRVRVRAVLFFTHNRVSPRARQRKNAFCFVVGQFEKKFCYKTQQPCSNEFVMETAKLRVFCKQRTHNFGLDQVL